MMRCHFRRPAPKLFRILISAGILCLTIAVRSYGDVTVAPGQDIQAAINSNYSGTTFIFSPGIYRNLSLVPKLGDIFIGQPGAILNGSTLLTTFNQNGSYWTSSIQITQVTAGGYCQAANPACTYPEDLFVDGQVYQRVASLSAVASGAWYLDYSAGTVYMVDNPLGHQVEISTLRHAFSGYATGVTIRGLIVEKYANPAQTGAIDCGTAANWTIQQNEIRYNHGAAIRVGGGAQVVNNYIHHQGQEGIAGSGGGVLLQNNEIAFNNTAGYDFGWEAGGGKLTNDTGLVVRGNYMHDNIGPGFHTDCNSSSVLYEGNRFERNKQAGIQHEISQSAIIRYNMIMNEGYGMVGTSAWWGAGIRILASSGVEIYGNTLVNCQNGIVGQQTNRGSNYLIQNLNVHDNVITEASGTATGIVAQSQFVPSIFTTWNNQFDHNTYHVPTLSGNYFTWGGSYLNWSYWQSSSNDQNGTLIYQ